MRENILQALCDSLSILGLTVQVHAQPPARGNGKV